MILFDRTLGRGGARRSAVPGARGSTEGIIHIWALCMLALVVRNGWDSTVISHDSVTITTFSILPRANELLRVPQPVFPDRTGTGSIPAKRFL